MNVFVRDRVSGSTFAFPTTDLHAAGSVERAVGSRPAVAASGRARNLPDGDARGVVSSGEFGGVVSVGDAGRITMRGSVHGAGRAGTV